MLLTGYQPQLTAAMATFLIVDSAAVAARLYVRLRVNKGFGWDDVFILMTYVGFVIMCGMGWTAMYYGYAAGSPTAAQLEHHDADRSQKFYFANQTTLYICAGLVKLAVALILYRLAHTRRTRILIVCSMAVVVVWTVVMTLFSSWICASGGASNFAGSQMCGTVGMFRTISNIFIDYFYALLPIWLLRKVQMGTRLKVTVCLLLGLGIFASSATIVKLVVIVRLQTATGAYADKLHYDLLLWADIELGMALFAAACAALRPLVRHLPAVWGSSGGGGGMESSSHGDDGAKSHGGQSRRKDYFGRRSGSAGLATDTSGIGGPVDDDRDGDLLSPSEGPYYRAGGGGAVMLVDVGAGASHGGGGGSNRNDDSELDRLDSHTGRVVMVTRSESESGSQREILGGKAGGRF